MCCSLFSQYHFCALQNGTIAEKACSEARHPKQQSTTAWKGNHHIHRDACRKGPPTVLNIVQTVRPRTGTGHCQCCHPCFPGVRASTWVLPPRIGPLPLSSLREVKGREARPSCRCGDRAPRLAKIDSMDLLYANLRMGRKASAFRGLEVLCGSTVVSWQCQATQLAATIHRQKGSGRRRADGHPPDGGGKAPRWEQEFSAADNACNNGHLERCCECLPLS